MVTPLPHHGIPLVIAQVRPPGPGGSSDQSPRLPLAKLQYDVRCKIIGGIFLMSKYWHIKNVEYCVSDLVKSSPEELSGCCIGRGDPSRGVFIRQRFQYVPQILITDSHSRLEIFSPVRGIHHPAFRRLDGQLFR